MHGDEVLGGNACDNTEKLATLDESWCESFSEGDPRRVRPDRVVEIQVERLRKR